MPGWGLFGNSPYRFLGIFQSRDQAERAARSLGETVYEVKYGTIERESGNFITPDLERQR
jgi:hypothetical protein